MFPWLAHAHISSYLSRRNFTVHLCSTAANFKSIENNIGTSIRIVQLHLPETHLPHHLHTTNGLPPRLKHTLDTAAPELRRVLAQIRPDLLVYDFFQPWAVSLGVPAVEFIASSATMMAYLFHCFSKPAASFPFPEIYYRDYELPALAAGERVRRDVFDGVGLSNGVVFIKGLEDNKIVLEDSLPLGFLERVEGRGLVVEGWAPQAQILGHESVVGFVSHCGCSSMMESMKFGVPIIAMPMHLDQPLNDRLVEQIGVGVEVVRGMLEREAVAAVIRSVVADEGVRRSAVSMSEKLQVKVDQEIEEVVQVLVKLCESNKKNKTNDLLIFGYFFISRL
ncbi:hypothetical protein SASPL_106842 [Salvia splendens]|uniref:UDP-glycosyltransferases domain-containing protein n=1 Tax=Salvia splendens TaxID=180675 RepID=A0A8X8Y9C3_SALSN|nr:hypothetical protein SASPL_106842 [Salvia splendens]